MRRLSLLASLLMGICLFAPFASAQERFLGSISLVPYNFAPFGTALCNGQILSISQNTALFSLLGTTYGGNGQTNFALPDLRGRMALGMGQGVGLSPRTQGELGGEESVTLTVAQLPTHSHQAVASASPGNTVSPSGAYWAPGPRLLLYSAPSGLVAMNPATVSPTGSNQSHDNRKPFLTLNYVIWMQGIFPSRS
jgi:microcystin-dependent protein